jgi:putative NADH-flavin reductase
MKVVVYGATGRTGRRVAERLLERGHAVVLLVRTPSKLQGKLGSPPADWAPRVTVQQGSPLNAADVERAIVGADAVVSALGPAPGSPPDLALQVINALIEAASKQGGQPTRFVSVSGAGARSPEDPVDPWLLRTLLDVVRWFPGPRTLMVEKEQEMARAKESTLAYTIVRPPQLTEATATGKYKLQKHRPGMASVSREDVATYIVDALEQQLNMREVPFIVPG